MIKSGRAAFEVGPHGRPVAPEVEREGRLEPWASAVASRRRHGVGVRHRRPRARFAAPTAFPSGASSVAQGPELARGRPEDARGKQSAATTGRRSARTAPVKEARAARRLAGRLIGARSRRPEHDLTPCQRSQSRSRNTRATEVPDLELDERPRDPRRNGRGRRRSERRGSGPTDLWRQVSGKTAPSRMTVAYPERHPRPALTRPRRHRSQGWTTCAHESGPRRRFGGRLAWMERGEFAGCGAAAPAFAGGRGPPRTGSTRITAARRNDKQSSAGPHRNRLPGLAGAAVDRVSPVTNA